MQKSQEQIQDAVPAQAVTSSARAPAGGHPLLGLQRSAGNAAVGRLVQREDDEPAAPTGDEAQPAAGAFDPDAILADMASGAVEGTDDGGGSSPSGDDKGGDLPVQELAASGVALQRDPPAATPPGATTKPADTADLLKALAAWGPFKLVLDGFKAEVEKSVPQTFSSAATPRSVFFTVAGLGAAIGTAQPIPIKPYLSVTLDPIGKKGVVMFDMGKLLKIRGFDGGPPAPGPAGAADGSPGRF